MQWYLVLVDIASETSNGKLVRLSSHRFVEFVSLVLHVFETTPALFKYGVNKLAFSSNFKRQWDIEQGHWLLLQEEIFKQWETFFIKARCWHYWRNMQVSMHMFDYGGNNTIVLS